MKYINNYAWFGRKAGAHFTSFLFGALAYRFFPDYPIWLGLGWMLIAGWAKNTEAANEIWFRRKKENPDA